MTYKCAFFCTFMVALFVPAVGYGQCSTQAIQPGLYWIKTIFDDGTHYCLDQADDDALHRKLVFSGCDRPQTEQFEVTPVPNGCYQIRLKSAIVDANNYRMLVVEIGPGVPPGPEERRWTKILNGVCYPGAYGGCFRDFQTWLIQNFPGPYPGPPWPGGTFKIKSVSRVEGYPNGWCIDRRDNTEDNVSEPQYLDCRSTDLHERYIFQRVDGAPTKKWSPSKTPPKR
jgi:hypothetical protein